jgi:hypothetical protein
LLTTGQITLVKQMKSCSNVNNGTINATLSGGLSSVQYIKLTQKYNGFGNSARNSGFTNCLIGTNVALSSNGATATASKIIPSGFGPQKLLMVMQWVIVFWHSNSVNSNEFITIG